MFTLCYYAAFILLLFLCFMVPQVKTHSMPPKEKYDVPTPNPQGRVDLDKSVGNKAKLLRCKREIIVLNMNVRTIREDHKQLELKYNFESHDLDILGIQEHLIMHDENVKYNTIGPGA